MRHIFFFLVLLINPIVFWLGGIFNEENSDVEIAFRNALLRENMDNTKFEFIPLVRQVDKEDSFQAEKIGLFFIFETISMDWFHFCEQHVN